MRSFLKCSSFIRVAIIMVVMAFLAGQVTETYAGKKDCKRGNHQPNKKGNKCKVCKTKIVKKITKIIINNDTSGGGSTNGACDPCDKLDEILDLLGNDNGDNGDNGGNGATECLCDDEDRFTWDEHWSLPPLTESSSSTCLEDERQEWVNALGGPDNWLNGAAACATAGTGYRLPTGPELETMLPYLTTSTIPAPPDDSWIWSSTLFPGGDGTTWARVVKWPSLGTASNNRGEESFYYFCVRDCPPEGN